MSKKIKFDTLRSLAFGSISGTYAAVGSPFTVNPRIICITNNTDADMIFSDDNTNSIGNFYLAKGTFKLFDLTANMDPNIDDTLLLPIGTTIYVKQAAAPSTGNVIVEIVYAV